MKTLILILICLINLASCGKKSSGGPDAYENVVTAQPLFNVSGPMNGFRTVYSDGKVTTTGVTQAQKDLMDIRPTYWLSNSDDSALTNGHSIYTFVEANKATLGVCSFNGALYSCSNLAHKDWRTYTLPNNVYDNAVYNF